MLIRLSGYLKDRTLKPRKRPTSCALPITSSVNTLIVPEDSQSPGSHVDDCSTVGHCMPNCTPSMMLLPPRSASPILAPPWQALLARLGLLLRGQALALETSPAAIDATGSMYPITFLLRRRCGRPRRAFCQRGFVWFAFFSAGDSEQAL